MKFLGAQFSYFFTQRDARRNLHALARYLLFIAATVVVYAAAFRAIMLHHEGQEHSWVTSVYWTLTVMSTLGFGDITFHTDLGRLFSIVVLLSGIVLLLIVLPFAFIRYFYAPWLETALYHKAPRDVPEETEGHVLICGYESIAAALVARLQAHKIPYFVLQPDVSSAAELIGEDISAVAGDLDSADTYRALRAQHARLVFANLDDATNTNITLTVREVSATTPVLAVVEDADSIDVLELAGANTVLPLKHQLGEQLAARVSVGRLHTHEVGRYQNLVIAELVVHDTALVGKSLRESGIRQRTGLNVIAYWDRGKLQQAHPDAVLTAQSVVVVMGTAEQIAALEARYAGAEVNDNPVLILGGGKVGRAAAHALRRRGIGVHVVEKDRSLEPRLTALADRVFWGDANDRQLLAAAGLESAPSVLLTTHDDATNTYLAVYCRRLNPKLRIVSRVTEERNVEAIHRAGADLVLSYSSLGVQSVLSKLQGHQMVMLGEGVDLFELPVPAALDGQTLMGSAIRNQTGLTCVAIQKNDHLQANPDPSSVLTRDSSLVVIGTAKQRKRFAQVFGS